MRKNRYSQDNEQTKNKIILISFSIIMLIGGSLCVVMTDRNGSQLSSLLHNAGLAFIVASIVSLFNELIIKRFSSISSDSGYWNLIDRFPPGGINMVAFPRQNFWKYHTWTLINDPQELFFAGRSVLHRIDADFKTRRFPRADDALLRKLEVPSKIQILYCNPTWPIISDLARFENQTKEHIYSHLAISMGIVGRIWDKLKDKELPGELEIRLYSEPVQYAYHRAKNISTEEKEMLIGFYFARNLGCRSPLFEIQDEAIQGYFEDHFNNVFGRADKLLCYPSYGQGAQFEESFFYEIKNFLENLLGENEVANYYKRK